MSGIDERVVEMKFDNKDFQKNVQGTLDSLDKLNKGLKLEGATKGLNDVAAATSKFSLAGIASGVENISSKFTNLGVVAISALANITTRAVSAGLSLVKSLSLDPVLQGLSIYETKLNSIQTILANTQGESNLNDVTKALGQLNDYSNQTIYNFGEMARNIGTFTAAGLKLDASVSAIKGIANLAAISGSSADQASTAMYQLSQALASGTVKLQDWNSVVNAGLGGKVFQQALMETARVHGVAIDKMVKEEGSFRNTLKNGWLTSQVLAETLSHFAGDLNDQQLKAQGYTAAQIKQLHVLAQTAQDAATKVKTFPQLMDVLKETVATGWAKTFEILFGNIDEAKDLFTNINNVISGFINTSANARNKVLGDWKALGGRTALLQGIADVFHAIIAVIKPVTEAFRSIFPPTTGKQLFDLTVSFENFAKKLKIGATTADEIKRTFAGVFAVFDIGWQIVKKIGGVISDLFGMIDKGHGGILKFTANIGDFFVALDKAIKSGQGLSIVFHNIENDLAPLIKLLNLLRGYIGGLFDGFDAVNAAKGLTTFAAKLEPFTAFSTIIAATWSNILTILAKVWAVFEPLAAKFGKFFGGLAAAIGGAFAGINYQDILGTINTGLFAGLLVLLKGFLDKMKKGDASSGLFSGIKEAIDELTSTFQTMQNTLRAATLLEIAAAIGIMTIACVALSKIDSNGLKRALAAMAVMFVQLGSGLFALEKTMSDKNLLKLYAVNTALIGLGVAIDVLTIALVKISKIPLKQLREGLISLGVLLTELIVTMKLMPSKEGMVASAVGLNLLAIAINILVVAVTNLGGLSWSELSKGLAGVAGILVSLALFSKFAKADAAGVLSGAGIVLLAAGIKILASAMQDLGKMGWGEIAKSLTAMLGALAIIADALHIIPPDAPLAAAGILVISLALGKIAVALSIFGSIGWGSIGKGLTSMLGALTIIAAALFVIPPSAPLGAAGILVTALALAEVANVLAKFGKMGWGDIGKAMAVLAGSLILIAGALVVMTGTVSGSAAVLVMSASLAVLAPILLVFASMSWSSILKGLTTLAGVFLILGVAGLALTPVIPALLGLGAAIALVGVGILAAGVGILAFSAALTALSIAGAAGTAAIVAMASALIGLIPYILTQLALGLVAFAKVIATAGPAFTAAITTVLTSLMDAIIKLTPKIIQTLEVLLEGFLQLLVKETPKIVEAGFKMLLALLTGIQNHIGQVVDKAVDIVVKLIEGITKSLPRLLQAGVTLVLKLISGIGDTVKNNGKAMADAAWNLVSGIIDGLVSATGELAHKAWDAAVKLVKGMWQAALDWLGIGSPSKKFIEIGRWSVLGLSTGITKFAPVAVAAGVDMASGTVDAISKTLKTIPDVLPDSMTLNPTITPVLDLSGVKKDAGQLNNMLTGGKISMGTSVVSARNAGTGFQDNVDSVNAGTTVTGNANTIFNQYNNSPKALSSAELYRQTRNQLSATKSQLPTTQKGVVVV